MSGKQTHYWLFGLVLLGVLIGRMPLGKTTELKNYGVKDRSIAGTLTSQAASEVLSEKGYEVATELTPYVKEASQFFELPPDILLAILYEEAVHRKPVDIETFGVAQVGLEELVIQGLPPDAKLLSNDRFSVWVLARKLKRLQMQTGSLKKAITLHNGYSDYLRMIEKRAADRRIRQLLQEKQTYHTYLA